MTKKWIDIGGPDGLPEDMRIAAIGNQAMLGQSVAVLLDATSLDMTGREFDDPGKVDRYIAKMLQRYPKLEVTHRGPGPVANVVLVRFGKKGN